MINSTKIDRVLFRMRAENVDISFYCTIMKKLDRFYTLPKAKHRYGNAKGKHVFSKHKRQ